MKPNDNKRRLKLLNYYLIVSMMVPFGLFNSVCYGDELPAVNLKPTSNEITQKELDEIENGKARVLGIKAFQSPLTLIEAKANLCEMAVTLFNDNQTFNIASVISGKSKPSSVVDAGPNDIEAFTKLKNEKFPCNIDRMVRYDQFHAIENSDYYLWEICGYWYLLDTKEPQKALCINFDTWGFGEIRIEKLSNGGLRIFNSKTDGAGWGLCFPHMQVCDIDLKNMKKTTYVMEATFWEDIDKCGTAKVILAQGTGHHFFWYWVIGWDGTKWVNQSAKYPDFYKTKVAKILSEHCGDPSGDDLQEKLYNYALRGGPASRKPLENK